MFLGGFVFFAGVYQVVALTDPPSFWPAVSHLDHPSTKPNQPPDKCMCISSRCLTESLLLTDGVRCTRAHVVRIFAWRSATTPRYSHNHKYVGMHVYTKFVHGTKFFFFVCFFFCFCSLFFFVTDRPADPYWPRLCGTCVFRNRRRDRDHIRITDIFLLISRSKLLFNSEYCIIIILSKI